jgi:beta-xylosidase
MDRRDVSLFLASLASGFALGCRSSAPVNAAPPPGARARSAAPLAAAPRVPAFQPWSPDLGDGTYKNPVLYADYSDPDVLRVGDEYYLTASSFNCTPGLPILVSRDLVNWGLIGHALENLPDPRYAQVQHGAGIWAPSLREHDGTFYLFAPTPDEGIYVLTAPHPRGPWSVPRMLLEGKGLIDPCPLWDDDGRAYLIHAYARSRAGIKDRLHVRPMDPAATRVLGDGRLVYWDPERQPTLEGPKFHKKDGFYYILAPAGGVENGWQLALRSRNVYGPYEARVVLERGATAINGPHQGALVDTPSGEWWFVHFQQLGVYGRVVHLNPVVWQDGWPLMGEAGPEGRREPVSRHAKPAGPVQPLAVPVTSDEFEGSRLSPAFQWHANHQDDWYSLGARPGFLRLFPQPATDFGAAPSLLLQKLPGPTFSLETWLELADPGSVVSAGLIVMGEHHAALAASGAAGGVVLRLLVDDAVTHEVRVNGPGVRLRLEFGEQGLCRFSFGARDGILTEVGAPFQAVPGRWIGSKVGLFSLAKQSVTSPAYADFDYFRFGALTSRI